MLRRLGTDLLRRMTACRMALAPLWLCSTRLIADGGQDGRQSWRLIDAISSPSTQAAQCIHLRASHERIMCTGRLLRYVAYLLSEAQPMSSRSLPPSCPLRNHSTHKFDMSNSSPAAELHFDLFLVSWCSACVAKTAAVGLNGNVQQPFTLSGITVDTVEDCRAERTGSLPLQRLWQ